MRKFLLFTSLLMGTVLLTTRTQAQNDRFAFAVTDLEKTGSSWNVLRKLDLKSGEFSNVLLNGTDINLPLFDATTKNSFKAVPDAKYGNLMAAPFNTGVAAMAYDKKNNRLYYTPMFIDQLRYIDLKTMKLYYVTDQSFNNAGNMNSDEGKMITRMVIAPDGNGYAISNDGYTFIKFTTGKKLQITQLGSLVDDPSNGSITIHNRCSCWGGDLIADDEGGLFILTNRNSVFKLNTETKVAKLLGYIKGLPQDFTTNGAVVTPEGKILVSSALNGNAYFLVEPKNWSATEYKATGGIFRSSDLANSNFLQTRPRLTSPDFISRKIPENPVPEKISIYPNPVSNYQFTIQFGKIVPGNYNMELTDVMGRLVIQRGINIVAEDQVETISIKSTTARGIYLVKLTDANKKAIHAQKIVVQ